MQLHRCNFSWDVASLNFGGQELRCALAQNTDKKCSYHQYQIIKKKKLLLSKWKVTVQLLLNCMFAYQKYLMLIHNLWKHDSTEKIEFYNLPLFSRGTKIVYAKVTLGRTERIVIKLLCRGLMRKHMLTMYCIIGASLSKPHSSDVNGDFVWPCIWYVSAGHHAHAPTI